MTEELGYDGSRKAKRSCSKLNLAADTPLMQHIKWKQLQASIFFATLYKQSQSAKISLFVVFFYLLSQIFTLDTGSVFRRIW